MIQLQTLPFLSISLSLTPHSELHWMITRCLNNDLMHFYEAEPQPFRHMQVVSCSGDSKNDLTI